VNAIAARASRRKPFRIIVGTAAALVVLLPVLALLLTGYLTWRKAHAHSRAREWHEAVSVADHFASFPSWLRSAIPRPWRSGTQRLGEEASRHIEESEKALKEERDAEADHVDEAVRIYVQLRDEDSPDYKARVDAIAARLRPLVENCLASCRTEGKWDPLRRLLNVLPRTPELVAEPTGLPETEKALEQARADNDRRLIEAGAAKEQRDWKRIAALALEARKTDPDAFFPATSELTQLAADANAKTKKAQEIAQGIEAALTGRKYKTATDGMNPYEELVPGDASELKNWKEQIAAAEAAQEKLAKELTKARAEGSPPAVIAEKVEAVIKGDPERYFPRTREVLDVGGERDWKIAWGKAIKAIERRDYAQALDSLADAARAESKLEGDLLVPAIEGEDTLVRGTASRVSEKITDLKKGIERAADELREHSNKGDLELAKKVALAILRADPSNWAGQTPKALEAYAEAWLAKDKGFVCIEGGSFLMGIEGDPAKDPLLARAFKAGVLDDMNKVRDAVPRFEATVTRFFMAAQLVSTAEFCDFLNAAERPQATDLIEVGPDAGVLLRDGKYHPAEGKDGLPITRVSWKGATEYCLRLQLQLQAEFEKGIGPEVQAIKIVCRLPSEAEWECAAAWKSVRERLLAEKRLYPGFEKAADAPKDAAPRAVSGRLDVSPAGCCDMSSNVCQWVSDWYGPYPREPKEDYRGPDRGEERVLRGGSFEKGIGLSFRRWKAPPEAKLPDVGFRVAIRLLR
jgi:formylglycine-generating enzyme required for sulfatase activity